MDRVCQDDIDVAGALQLAVLRPISGNRFRQVGELPGWWSSAVGCEQDGEIAIVSDYLDSFLGEAEASWNNDNGVGASAIFEVAGEASAEPLHLQALTVRSHGQPLLILRNLNVTDGWLPAVLRTAREQLLHQANARVRHGKQLARLTADREEARRSEQLKSEFLANVSHEIRTPLTTILSMAELAMQTNTADASAHLEQHLAGILDAARRLLRLSNDILDLSRIQAGRLELDDVPFSIRQLLNEIAAEWQLQAEQRGLALDVEVAPDVRDPVRGDPFRLRQVLANLVGNALKFTHQGGVTVSAAAGQTDQDGVSFCVTDTGIGILSDHLERVFETFIQAPSSAPRQDRGAGLGLAIASKLVRLMDGELQVESQLGVGSRFFFVAHLPACAPESSDQPPAGDRPRRQAGTPNAARPLSILVAEDHDLNRSLIVDLLRARGHTTVEAADGAAAVEAWRQASFDVVLMDCRMPTMSGLDAVQLIRQAESKAGRRTPIIALSAHAMNDQRRQALRDGVDEYLTKPFDAEELVQLVEGLGDR